MFCFEREQAGPRGSWASRYFGHSVHLYKAKLTFCSQVKGNTILAINQQLFYLPSRLRRKSCLLHTKVIDYLVLEGDTIWIQLLEVGTLHLLSQIEPASHLAIITNSKGASSSQGVCLSWLRCPCGRIGSSSGPLFSPAEEGVTEPEVGPPLPARRPKLPASAPIRQRTEEN